MTENLHLNDTAEKPAPPAALRWLVLVVISLAMFGNYYIYDAISPLADVLKAQLGFSDANLGTMNAIYSLPNIIMVLIGGFIIDRIGTRKSTFFFAVLCLVGAAITAFTPDFWMMVTGRLVFGIGAESLIVAITTALAKWFRGKELGLAFGLNLTIARLGSFAALNSPTWARDLFALWQLPLLVTVMAGFICVAAAAGYRLMEARADRRYSLGEADETDKVKFSDIFSFSKSYWFIVALCATFYSAVFPFQTFLIKFFIEFHGTTREWGGFLSSLLVFFAMICTPLFGYLADRWARRSVFMMVGSLMLIPVYFMLMAPGMLLLLPMGLMGIAFSVVPAVMWPSVTYTVDKHKLGTAYGLMTMVQNGGLALFNFLIGSVNDASSANAANPGGYWPMMLIFSMLGFLGLYFAFLLRRSETGPGAHGLETITTKSAS